MDKTLYLIPLPIGPIAGNETIPDINIEIINRLTSFIVENTRTARRFIKNINPTAIIDNLSFFELNEHTPDIEIINYFKNIPIDEIGLMSEAGVPCIADPGQIAVRLAHQNGIRVVPLVGPSSILLSLMASGLNGQRFAFHGYLPVKKELRLNTIKNLEKKSLTDDQSQIFIEAPYRNNLLLEDLLSACSSDTLLHISCDLQSPSQLIKTMSIQDWRKSKPDLNKRPSIFIIKRN